MSKIDLLIERLKKAKEIMEKDELDDKIKAKILAEMNRRNFTERDAADHMRDVDESIPAKQRANIKNSLKVQRAKQAKIETPKPEQPKLKMVKSIEELADELIESLTKKAPSDKAKDKVSKQEFDAEEMGLDKSNYGPKGMGLYNPTDNINRKARNTGDEVGEGKNIKVKAYSTKPGQLSAKAQAAVEAKRDAEKTRANPVKRYSKEEIQAMYPNAKVEKSLPEWSENEMANALAKLAFKPKLQPTNEEFEQAAINSGMAITQDQVNELNKGWGGAINNWFAEASKPLSSRFKTPEEEQAYWDSIKVSDDAPKGSGY